MFIDTPGKVGSLLPTIRLLSIYTSCNVWHFRVLHFPHGEGECLFKTHSDRVLIIPFNRIARKFVTPSATVSLVLSIVATTAQVG